MLPTGNTFDNTNNYKIIFITNAKICAVITTNTRLVKKIVKRKENSKHELKFMGMFPITKINDNVVVCFQKGIINDAINTSIIKPFFD